MKNKLQYAKGTSKDQQTRVESHVSGILAAKRRGEKAQSDVYRLCMEFEDSQEYIYLHMTWPQVLRGVLGVNSGAYAAYAKVVRVLGSDQGLPVNVMQAISTLQGSPEKIKAAAAEVSATIDAFRTEKGFMPSSSYAKTLIAKAAANHGLHLPEVRDSAVAKLRRAIACLRKIAAAANAAQAPSLASACLVDIGAEEDMEEAA